MKILDHFSIPFKGLGNGMHSIEFSVNDSFFKAFENAQIDNGQFTVNLELEKKFDHSELFFDIEGFTKTTCDRCMEPISLPVRGSYKLLLKVSEDEESTDEILFISPETSTVNLAQVIYEYICLSLPLTKIYDCEDDENPPCNEQVLERLGFETEEEEDDEESTIWDSLKGLDFDNE